MKIMILNLENASPSILFSHEKMETLQYLLGLASFGVFNGQSRDTHAWMILASLVDDVKNAPGPSVLTILDYLEQAGKKCVSIGGQTYSYLKELLTTQEWDFCSYLDRGFSQQSSGLDYYLEFDRELGGVLGSLSDETVILIIATQDQSSGFILAAPNNPLVGEQKEVTASNIAPTLLELAGYPLPESAKASSLIAGLSQGDAGTSGLTEEEEAILRERLSGLGYI